MLGDHQYYCDYLLRLLGFPLGVTGQVFIRSRFAPFKLIAITFKSICASSHPWWQIWIKL